MLLEQLQASVGATYTIERELGGGGMSKVFLATENRLNRKVVVKVLSPKSAEAVSMMMPILEVPGLRRLEKIGVTAYGLARAGRTREARLLLERAKAQPDKPESQSGIIAAAFDALGDREKALEVLRAAVRNHDLWLGHYSAAAPYDGLRKDPRVRALFSEISAR